MLLNLNAPTDKIREQLQECRYEGKCEDKDDVPRNGRCEVEEGNDKRKPEPGTPRAVYERAKRTAKRLRVRSYEPMTNELGDNVIGEKTHKTRDGKRYEEEVGKRHWGGELIVRREPKIGGGRECNKK